MSLLRWALAWPVVERRPRAVESSRRLRELVHDHLDAIYRTARRLGVPPSDIEDLVQDVMVVVVRRLSDIQDDKVASFLVGTTVRVAANRRRRSRRHPEISSESLAATGPGIEASAAGQTSAKGERAVDMSRRLALLQAALAEMTAPQRAAFVLFELEEHTAREVGEQLGVSESTIVSRVRRAREVLWRVCEERGYPAWSAAPERQAASSPKIADLESGGEFAVEAEVEP
jgi:RNA polymerase sigma-70 factor, ECF subfamily